MSETRYFVGNECETADTYFRWIASGYCDDYPPEVVEEMASILRGEKKEKEAEYVNYYFADIAEKKKIGENSSFVSVNQIKVDYLGGYTGSEETVYYNDADTRIIVWAQFERRNENIFVYIDRLSNEGHGSTVIPISWNKFKDLSQKDFERLLNETLFYMVDEPY